jgi:hypothetical protein
MTSEAVFQLKQESQRLQKVLQEMSLSVSQEQAQHLIARMRFEPNWGALESRVRRESYEQEWPEAKRTQWLQWVAALMRIQGLTEENLMDLVCSVVGPQRARQLAGQGMCSQLHALLLDIEADYGTGGDIDEPHKYLVAILQNRAPGKLWLPTGESRRVFVPLHVTCEKDGESIELAVVDCLEWFASASTEEEMRSLVAVEASRSSGLAVFNWLYENSLDEHVCNSMTQCRVRAKLQGAPLQARIDRQVARSTMKALKPEIHL